MFGASLGGGKIDQDCSARENARLYAAIGSRFAACKQLAATKQAKTADISIADCMVQEEPKPVSAPIPVSQIQPAVALPVLAPVPVAAPIAVVPDPTLIPAAHFTVKPFATCRARYLNECKRFLDSVSLLLRDDDSAMIALNGPISAIGLLEYLHNERRIDPARVSMRLEDVDTISISVMSDSD
jgi:hypothetical protein